MHWVKGEMTLKVGQTSIAHSLCPAQRGRQAESSSEQKISGACQLGNLWFVAQAGLELAMVCAENDWE